MNKQHSLYLLKESNLMSCNLERSAHFKIVTAADFQAKKTLCEIFEKEKFLSIDFELNRGKSNKRVRRGNCLTRSFSKNDEFLR